MDSTYECENIYEVCLNDLKKRYSSSSENMAPSVPSSFSAGPGRRTTSLIIMCVVFTVISQSSVVAAFLIFPAKISELEQQIRIIRDFENNIKNAFNETIDEAKAELYGATRGNVGGVMEAIRLMNFAPNCTQSGNDSPYCVETFSGRIARLEEKLDKHLNDFINITDHDDCENRPCLNNGLCIDRFQDFICICGPNWHGKTCEEDTNECNIFPCQNGAVCTNLIGTYNCACVSGWTDANCTKDINECDSTPCANGGTCANGENQFTCYCTPGWTNATCTEDIDECESSPCENGGTCVNGQNRYTCNCGAGWTGANCTEDIDECESSPCENGGECINEENRYTCNCGAGWTGATCTDAAVYQDCGALLAQGTTSDGVYTIHPSSASSSFEVYCDMTTDGGGWTVFQRRKDGTQDFYLDWNHYKAGFGSKAGEHWLGNDHLNEITSSGAYQLRVDLKDWSEVHKYALYNSFTVGPETDKYRLLISGYSGTAGDSMIYSSSYTNNNQQFSTRDQDNDRWSSNSCATYWPGAWWFNNCSRAFLNGRYVQGGSSRGDCQGIHWLRWRNDCTLSLKFTEMKLRLVS